VVATLARVALGAVLLVAGAAKLRDRSWPPAAAALGVPTAVARLVPAVEIGLGAMVVPGAGGVVPVMMAVGLLLAMTMVLAANLARGRRPVCACFGSMRQRPIGAWTIVRNLALMGVGALALT